MSDDTTGAGPVPDPFATSAGAYVLGALTPSDRDAFERHLRTCPDCRRAVEDLAGLPGLLSRVPREVVDALEQDDRGALAAFGGTTAPEALAPAGAQGPPLPETVLAGLLREVRRRRVRRRAVLTGGLVAAAALVAAVAGDVFERTPSTQQASTPPPTQPLPPAESMEQVLADPVPVTATVRLTDVLWGTKVDLTCAYAQEGAEPYDYALYVRPKTGEDEQIGTWKAFPGRDARLSAATALSLDQIAAVEIRTMTGITILRLLES